MENGKSLNNQLHHNIFTLTLLILQKNVLLIRKKETILCQQYIE